MAATLAQLQQRILAARQAIDVPPSAAALGELRDAAIAILMWVDDRAGEDAGGLWPWPDGKGSRTRSMMWPPVDATEYASGVVLASAFLLAELERYGGGLPQDLNSTGKFFGTPDEGRALLGEMEHTIWTLAFDLRDGGTGSEVYKSEEELKQGWLGRLGTYDPADVPEEFGEDEWLDFVDDHKADSLDTFDWSEETLRIPVYSAS